MHNKVSVSSFSMSGLTLTIRTVTSVFVNELPHMCFSNHNSGVNNE